MDDNMKHRPNASILVQKTFLICSMLVVMAFMGCSSGVVFEKSEKIGADGWHFRDTIVFQTEIADTLALYDIYLNVRNDQHYPYRNLFVFFETRFPDGRIFRDTIEAELADRTGQWKGSGFGRVKSNSFHFRKDVWFPLEGKYTFTIEQAMREEYLRGITDIGIRIEQK